MQRCYRWVIVSLVALQSVLGAMPALAQSHSRAETEAGEPRDRTRLTLVAEAVGSNTVQLLATATPFEDAPALQIHWDIGTAQMVDGPLDETLGAFAGNSTAQQTRVVVFPGQGIYPLGVTATYHPFTGAMFGASAMLFALVDAGGVVTLTNRDPNAVSPMNSVMQTSEPSEEPEAGSASVERADDDPCFTVHGVVTREDRVNTNMGQQPPRRVPVRNAYVEMREEDVLFDDSYGESRTDAFGNYSFRFCDDDGLFDDELELYVRLRAELFVGGLRAVDVTDSSWIDETYQYRSEIRVSDGGDETMNLELNVDQSIVFNIADAILDAYTFWNNSGGAAGDDDIFMRTAQVHWEPGYGDETSYYNGYIFDELTIADGPNDPDGWDDSVIIHEWGHMADDQYGCDDNPGDNHNFGQVLDTELSWGEGYPDYYQSVVRHSTGAPSPNFYIETNAAGAIRFTVDLENLASPANAAIEDAVASMLWDLYDPNDATWADAGDRVGLGHPMLQEVYTHPEFESNGNIFDDECTATVYLYSWRNLNKPTDAATAAAVRQNVGASNPNPFTMAATTAAAQGLGMAPAAQSELQASGGRPEDYVWWQKVTMVVDNSASMAGAKFDAAKTVMQEQINDLDDSPQGVEFGLYTFNNVLPASQEVLSGRFYGDMIVPQIQGLATRPPGEANEPCPVRAFDALTAAIQDKRNGEAWLYTDGDALSGPGVEETMQQMLTTRGLRGSFVMMGGCNSPAVPQSDTPGAAYNFLGKAANGTQSAGIVPYLLTAIATGGNFLFVNETQLADAGDILRAQLSHSAGAGRWSDYVSLSDTYIWDKLASWEYNWIQPGPEDRKGHAVEDNLSIAIPPVTVYGRTYDVLQVNGDGYIAMGPEPIPPVIPTTDYLDILNADLEWYFQFVGPNATTNVPNAPNGYLQDVYAEDTGGWVVITTAGYRDVNVPRAYQALINKNTGEIRYQYQAVDDDDAGNAIIDVSWFDLNTGLGESVIVSNRDTAGARPGTGYKLTPVPPQPSKSYDVAVDAEMSGVGFLLTGYSGYFNPLSVTDPNGTAVSCNEEGALCLNLGLVQYVQVNVNGRTGLWHATVSGEGTFSFNAMATSAIKVESPYDHQLPIGELSPLLVKLGAPTADNELVAWFQRPDGSIMGGEFTLFDDGTNGDNGAGDGDFGLPDFIPPGEGVAYLWVRGTVNGTEVQRSDPAPYNFQPLKLEGPATVAYYGDGTVGIDYTLTNLGDKRYCYYLETQLPEGWYESWLFTEDELIDGFCLNPGESATRTNVVTPASLQGAAPSGSLGEIVVTFGELERRQIVDSISTTLVRFNVPAVIGIENHYTSNYLRPNGSDAVPLTVGVYDSEGYPVEDGTVVEIATTLGTVAPTVGATINGRLDVLFTAGNTAGDAEITASVGNLSATTVIHIQDALPEPNQMEFEVTPTDLRQGSSASLVVTVRDQWGNPVEGQLVRLGVEDDGASGVITGATDEVLTLTTNAEGQVAATFIKAQEAVGVEGEVGVRAELLFDQGAGLEVVAEKRRTIVLSDAAVSDTVIFLPMIQHN
jgi:hypothetical protein